jgi:hypothetical protein
MILNEPATAGRHKLTASPRTGLRGVAFDGLLILGIAACLYGRSRQRES